MKAVPPLCMQAQLESHKHTCLHTVTLVAHSVLTAVRGNLPAACKPSTLKEAHFRNT